MATADEAALRAFLASRRGTRVLRPAHTDTGVCGAMVTDRTLSRGLAPYNAIVFSGLWRVMYVAVSVPALVRADVGDGAHTLALPVRPVRL